MPRLASGPVGVVEGVGGEVTQETTCCVLKCNVSELRLYLFNVFSRASNAEERYRLQCGVLLLKLFGT